MGLTTPELKDVQRFEGRWGTGIIGTLVAPVMAISEEAISRDLLRRIYAAPVRRRRARGGR